VRALTLLPCSISPCVAILLVLVVSTSAVADDTIVDVTYSHRQIRSGTDPDMTIVEGSIIASFSANNPIELLLPDPEMIRIDEFTFEYLFPWDWDSPHSVDFIDEFDEIISVVAWPQPVYPFDPGSRLLPVMHIQTDSTNLWDPEIGIYVWGNHDNFLQTGVEWERHATLTLYDNDSVAAFSEPIGLRINGNTSRYRKQKGLRIYFDDYGDSDQIEYDIFGSEPTSFRRLIFKTACRIHYMLCTNLVEGVFGDLGHLRSRSKFYETYINGEYWGGYNIRERIDREFVEHTHEIANDDYILIKDGAAVHGDLSDWADFRSSFSDPADYSSHAWYEGVSETMDMTNYIDWIFLNNFFASTDNGYDWNLAILKVGPGPWRFITWDAENIMRLENLNANYFRFYSAADEEEYEYYLPPRSYWFWTERHQEWCNIFRSLMHNSEFKALYSHRVDSLLTTQLTSAGLGDRFDELRSEQVPSFPWHPERWDWVNPSPAVLDAAITNYMNWINDRIPILLLQKDEFMAYWRVPVELSRFSAAAETTTIELTWRTEAETDNLGFIVYRSVDTPDNMAELASYLTHPELIGQANSEEPTEYAFSDDSASSDHIYYYQLFHVSSEQVVTEHAWVEAAWFQDIYALAINEFLASNDTTLADEFGEFDDWVEIFNTGVQAVELAGLHLSDDETLPDRWTFPEITLGAGEYLLIWCDDDPEQGPLHTNFKLSASGETILLSTAVADGLLPIDRVDFGEQSTDVSYGRFPDGSETWAYFAAPTPGAANLVLTAAPEVPGATPLRFRYEGSHPNPFNARTTLVFSVPADGMASLRIYDLAGRLVRTLHSGRLAAGQHRVTWDGRDDAGRDSASGAYLIRLGWADRVNNRVDHGRVLLAK